MWKHKIKMKHNTSPDMVLDSNGDHLKADNNILVFVFNCQTAEGEMFRFQKQITLVTVCIQIVIIRIVLFYHMWENFVEIIVSTD